MFISIVNLNMLHTSNRIYTFPFLWIQMLRRRGRRIHRTSIVSVQISTATCITNYTPSFISIKQIGKIIHFSRITQLDNKVRPLLLSTLRGRMAQVVGRSDHPIPLRVIFFEVRKSTLELLNYSLG